MGSLDPKELLIRAQTAAFRLLKVRQRSEAEIRERLARKNFPPEIVEGTLSFLRTHSFVDDAAFTRWWIKSRLNKPFGLTRIRLELRQKGVSEDILREELALAAEDLDEAALISVVIKKRLGRYQGLEPLKRKKRLFDFLARRGFSVEAIQKAIRKI